MDHAKIVPVDLDFLYPEFFISSLGSVIALSVCCQINFPWASTREAIRL